MHDEFEGFFKQVRLFDNISYMVYFEERWHIGFSNLNVKISIKNDIFLIFKIELNTFRKYS